MDILQRLKVETASAHDHVERAFDLDAALSNLTAYRETLVRFYGIHAGWEPALETACQDPAFVRPRLKAQMLLSDLRALGIGETEIRQIEICRPPDMHSAAEGYGAMYVFEGSTLGGAIIARQARKRLGVHEGSGGSYFRSYGHRIGPMWNAFRQRLLSIAGAGRDEAIIASARATFARVHEWLSAETQVVHR